MHLILRATMNTPKNEIDLPKEKDEQKNKDWGVMDILSEATDIVESALDSGLELISDAVSLIGE